MLHLSPYSSQYLVPRTTGTQKGQIRGSALQTYKVCFQREFESSPGHGCMFAFVGSVLPCVRNVLRSSNLPSQECYETTKRFIHPEIIPNQKTASGTETKSAICEGLHCTVRNNTRDSCFQIRLVYAQS
jgi:hypothetical protein